MHFQPTVSYHLSFTRAQADAGPGGHQCAPLKSREKATMSLVSVPSAQEYRCALGSAETTRVRWTVEESIPRHSKKSMGLLGWPPPRIQVLTAMSPNAPCSGRKSTWSPEEAKTQVGSSCKNFQKKGPTYLPSPGIITAKILCLL